MLGVFQSVPSQGVRGMQSALFPSAVPGSISTVPGSGVFYQYKVLNENEFKRSFWRGLHYIVVVESSLLCLTLFDTQQLLALSEFKWLWLFNFQCFLPINMTRSWTEVSLSQLMVLCVTLLTKFPQRLLEGRKERDWPSLFGFFKTDLPVEVPLISGGMQHRSCAFYCLM